MLQETNAADELRFRPLKPFGVELQTDLTASLSPAQSRQFVALLWEHGLVLARGQRLSMQRQRDQLFARSTLAQNCEEFAGCDIQRNSAKHRAVSESLDHFADG